MISNSLLRTLRATSCIAALMTLSLTLSVQAQSPQVKTQHFDGNRLLLQGHQAIIKGQNQVAVSILSKIIMHKGTDRATLAKAFLKRAVAYQRLGYFRSAINNYNFAEDFRILPKKEVRDLLYNRAHAYKLSGKPDEALLDQKTLQAIDMQAGLSASRQSMAQAHRRSLQVQNSVRKQPRRVRVNVQDVAPTVTAAIPVTKIKKPQAKLQRAHYAILRGQNKTAIKILTKIIRDEKTDKNSLAQAFLKRGVAYRRRGKVAASISDFTNAADLKALSKEDERDLLFNRAKAYKAVGMNKLALQDTQSLQKIDGLFPKMNPRLEAPLTTASISKGGSSGQSKKKKHLRVYKAVAQPKTLVEHIKKMMKPSVN